LSISSCPRNWRMAFLGASFFWAAPPPNQPIPQPDMTGDRIRHEGLRCVCGTRASVMGLRGAAFYGGQRGSIRPSAKGSGACWRAIRAMAAEQIGRLKR
jgi:hypothetical protein